MGRSEEGRTKMSESESNGNGKGNGSVPYVSAFRATVKTDEQGNAIKGSGGKPELAIVKDPTTGYWQDELLQLRPSTQNPGEYFGEASVGGEKVRVKARPAYILTAKTPSGKVILGVFEERDKRIGGKFPKVILFKEPVGEIDQVLNRAIYPRPKAERQAAASAAGAGK
jgi:hypothetical protein